MGLEGSARCGRLATLQIDGVEVQEASIVVQDEDEGTREHGSVVVKVELCAGELKLMAVPNAEGVVAIRFGRHGQPVVFYHEDFILLFYKNRNKDKKQRWQDTDTESIRDQFNSIKMAGNPSPKIKSN